MGIVIMVFDGDCLVEIVMMVFDGDCNDGV